MPNMNFKNKKYIDFVKSLPCCHSGQYGVDPHHIIQIGMGTMGGKAPDICAMPLIRAVHDAVHDDPDSWPQIRWMIETQKKAIEAGILK